MKEWMDALSLPHSLTLSLFHSLTLSLFHSLTHMNETLKTAAFLITTLVLLSLAFVVSLPRNQENPLKDIPGKEIPSKLKDVQQVHSLEIVRYDAQRGEIRPFEVRQTNHRWVLPSHENYPADAKDRVARAAGGLVGLRVVSVVSDDASSHAEYGVIMPDPKSPPIGATGVGQRVIIKDEKRDTLLDLIIGKEVNVGKKRHYVRLADQTPVYTVELDASQLSSDFADWIERDLMRVQPWDITSLIVQDYSLEDGVMAVNGIVELKYDDMNRNEWTLIQNLEQMITGGFRSKGIPTGKRLNTKKLNICRNALADMRIVDVAAKPEELTAALKNTGNYSFSAAGNESLEEKGFYVARQPIDGGREAVTILSKNGDISVATTTGIQYILRFGNVAGTASADADSPLTLNRYLMIMADLDTQAIPQPHRQELPEIPAGVSDVEKAQWEAERKVVEAANLEALEEYEEAVAEAKKRASMLNERFAQWYYVIPESVYQDIRLTYQTIFTAEADDEDEEHECDEDCDHGHAHETEVPAAQEVTESSAEETEDEVPVFSEERLIPETSVAPQTPQTDIFAGAADMRISEMIEEEQEDEAEE